MASIIYSDGYVPTLNNLTNRNREIQVVKHDLFNNLTAIERDVLCIAKEILKLKRYKTKFQKNSEIIYLQKYPIIEKLYAKCIAKLHFSKGYTKKEIFRAIQALEKKYWIVSNERRTKAEILNNKKYLKILNFIEKYPGIYGRDIKIEKKLKITRGPFLKYIITLNRFNLVRSKKIGKRVHYFLSDIPEIHDELKALFLNPLILKIIKKIKINKNINTSQIADSLNIYSGTIAYHIKKLIKVNVLKRTKTKKGVYTINYSLLRSYNNIFLKPDFSKLFESNLD